MLGSSLSHLVLPACAVAAYPSGVIARMVRASILDVAGETHVQMLRAFGFREGTIFNRFAMRTSPGTLSRRSSPSCLRTRSSTRSLWSRSSTRPGLGSYAGESIIALDTPAIIGITLFVALVYVFVNLAVDLIQAALDPRIRLH